jgi:hypothetical protein
MDANKLVQPAELRPLSGPEALGPTTVLEFWRWALGDLRMNNARGHLVEFLVARALGDTSRVRVEWGSYDVEAADGTLVEVKATARLQSWATKRLSNPSWSFKSVRHGSVWSDDLGDYVDVEPETRVHVWVFALQTAIDPTEYDPLDVGQWEFRVVPHRQLLATGQVSARLSFFDRLEITPVPYSELQEAVMRARMLNDELARSST